LPSFWDSIRTPSPAAAASCWIRMSRSAASDGPAPDANRWEKNARSKRGHRNPAGTRHCRRSPDRHSLDPQDAGRNRRTAAATRYRDLRHYRGAVASRSGFFLARESQSHCHRLQPGWRPTVPLHLVITYPLRAPGTSHPPRRYQKTRPGRHFQKQWRQMESHARARP